MTVLTIFTFLFFSERFDFTHIFEDGLLPCGSNSFLSCLCCCCQSPTRGWFRRPKAPFLRGATVTAAPLTPPAAACTSTAATRLFLPTSTAWWTTFTATTSTRAPGKKQLTFRRLFRLKKTNRKVTSQCASTHVHRPRWRWQVHPEGEQLPAVPPLSCPAQRHPAGLRRQHAQRHVPQQRRQVFLRWLHGLRHRWDSKLFLIFSLSSVFFSYSEF